MAHPKRLHSSELMQAAAAFDALNEVMLLSGRTTIDQIDRSLINSENICGSENADVRDPKSRSKPSRYSSENDVLIEKSVKYTDFFLLSIVYV